MSAIKEQCVTGKGRLKEVLWMIRQAKKNPGRKWFMEIESLKNEGITTPTTRIFTVYCQPSQPVRDE